MPHEDNGFFGGEEQSTVSVRERLLNYLANWPLFLICVLVCVATGVIYARYTVSKYIASTTFLVKSSDNGASNSNDLIEEALNSKRELNLNNEILLISSSRLFYRTIVKNNFNVSYFRKGRLLNVEIYKDSPFILVAKELTDVSRTYSFYIKTIDIFGGTLLYGPEKAERTYSFQWGVPFVIEGETFTFIAKRQIRSKDGDYIVQWHSAQSAAAELSKDLTVRVFDPKTSVIELSIKTQNLQKGKDILNALFAEFNLSDIEDRNKLSENTVKFIDERLTAISSELKQVEGNLESYQGKKQLIDIKGQSTQSLENLNIVSRTMKDLAIQQGIVAMISEYFSSPANKNKLVPSSLGIDDATLSTLITQYNELQLKKEREAPQVAPNSDVMQDLNTQIGSLKGSILESLNNISKNLRLQQNSFQEQNSQYRSYISTVPRNERVLQEISRKQSITEGLYLYLLQKREESAISSTSANVANYKQIDPAQGYGPVEPNTRNIIVYTALLGLTMAFGWIYIRDLLNDKVMTKEDITKRTSLAVIGEVSHIAKRNQQVISILGRDLTGEQFRVIRTNLSFLIKDKSKKVFLVTSSVSGEGKSFISLNLAAVLAMPGKKVALLEFDLRQPTLANNLHVENSKGITNYLTGEVNNIWDIYRPLDKIPGLHIYPCGPQPANPADLLLTDNINQLFKDLRSEYDYIVVDTSPAGLVSDPLIIGKYADVVLYVVRYSKTLKKQLSFISTVVHDKTLNNVAVIFNDVKNIVNYGYTYGNDKKYPNIAESWRKKKVLSSLLK